MKKLTTLFIVFIGFFSDCAADSLEPGNFIFEEGGRDFPVHQNPGFNLRASFIANHVVFGVRFSKEFELTPASFEKLRVSFLKTFPLNEFGEASLLRNKGVSDKKEITWTFGKILSDHEIKIWGQMIVSYSDIEDTGYPMISGVIIKSTAEADAVDKNQILKLWADGKQQREQMAALPPVPKDPDDIKPDNEWKTFAIGKSDMEISFPAAPQQQASENLPKVEQYTSKIYTEDSYRFSFVYFITVLKFNTVAVVDNATFVNTVTTSFNTLIKNKYQFEITSETETSFKNCVARSTKANVEASKGDKFKYDGLSLTRKNYVVFMFVLADTNYVDIEGRIPRFFNSLEWKH